MKTRTPNGPGQMQIDPAKYELVKKAILASLSKRTAISYDDLLAHVKKRLKGFEGSVDWHTKVVQLDLEANGLVSREGRPIRLRRA